MEDRSPVLWEVPELILENNKRKFIGCIKGLETKFVLLCRNSIKERKLKKFPEIIGLVDKVKIYYLPF